MQGEDAHRYGWQEVHAMLDGQGQV